MAFKRLKKYASFYKIAHAERAKLYHLKWRVFFILLAASAMIIVNDYLQSRYPYTVYDALKATTFPLADKLFSWFATGVLFGIIAFAVMNEGEFLLNLRGFVHFIEQEAMKVVGIKKPKGAKKKKK